LRIIITIVSLLFAASCGKASDSPATNGASEQDGGAGASGTTASTTANSGIAPFAPSKIEPGSVTPSPLGGAFAQEAANRSHHKPEVEDAFAAFAKAGLEPRNVKQGLGRTSFAQYCQLTDILGEQRAVVCEYADDAAASKALPEIQAQLVDPRRSVTVHGRLMLTIMLTENTPVLQDERDKLIAAFESVAAPQ